MIHYHVLRLPYIAYWNPHLSFYAGWRLAGEFGLKLNVFHHPIKVRHYQFHAEAGAKGLCAKENAAAPRINADEAFKFPRSRFPPHCFSSPSPSPELPGPCRFRSRAAVGSK